MTIEIEESGWTEEDVRACVQWLAHNEYNEILKISQIECAQFQLSRAMSMLDDALKGTEARKPIKKALWEIHEKLQEIESEMQKTTASVGLAYMIKKED